ncbi:ectonucleoside triphosphate diphosphohydrolase 1 isoform X3 [Prionailurus viverrinus]|uniref:ectonucleoside triphosphate diphosphohydrolase 1 isoform X2 n=1 Tax=Prionailurus bengalensis TaxID=37029 RepID=UPI001CA80DCC|nr:ectonucleoside triphosphate diphosphohydrolase 1 isoform X2 [Prionailurus bengalensis]XP_047680792.1 ectonucleoside triphosphate diphosphohydrolase 1 isoform X3 [Prionailurus viverrinus]
MEDRKESELKSFCSRNILIILGFSSIMAVIALIAVGLTQNKPLPENVKYGIVLDAGSSHTSLYIYKWPAEKENDTGVVHQIEECKLKGPGISRYAQRLNEIDAYLTECMERASQVIPKSQHQGTPVYLGATAGMRLLRMENEKLADKVLSVVTKSLNNYHFDFHGARIITGQEEGAYGWITINYLLGKFTQKLSWLNLKPNGGNSQGTYGALDLGGASTQITFVPQNERIESPSNALHFRLYGKDYSVYTHSFLCYGKDQALRQKLAKDIQAFSAYYYVMEFLNFTSEETPTQEKVIDSMEKFCSQPWNELKTYFGDVKEKYLSEYCFSGAYILSLLLNGYHFTADSWKNIHFMGKIHSSSVGWTLGYMLNLTNMIPAEEPLSTPLSHSTYVFLMVLFSLILVAVAIIGLFIFHKPSYFWKDMV